MDNLIARLSAGERWDGDNAEVLKALGWTERHTGEWLEYPSSSCILPMPKPIDSVDDALRLVPEGWRTVSAFQLSAGDRWLWTLLGRGNTFYGRGPTAAIALTIAILEASRG